MDFLPSKRPRIFEIEDPTGGHFKVGVEVDSKFVEVGECPPWGTEIETIVDSSFVDARYVGMILTNAKMGDKGVWTFIFERLPGPLLTGETVTQDGQVATITRQRVAAGESVPVPNALTVSAQVTPETPAAGMREVVTVPEVFDQKGVSVRIPDSIPDKFMVAVPQTTEDVVEAGTSVGTVSLASDEIAKSVQRVSEHKVKKSVTKRTIPGTFPDFVGKKQGMWGVEDVTESLKNASTITPAYGTKDSETVQVASGLWVSREVDYPATPATLVEYRTDEQTGIVIKMEKSLVDPASALPIASETSLVERQAIDKWHSIQIVSSRVGTTLPATETWDSVVQISLPDVLQEVGVYWQTDYDAGSGYNAVEGAKTWPLKKSWDMSASAKASCGITGGAYTKIKNGFRGPAKATVKRTYHNGPPSLTITPHKFEPVVGQIIVFSFNGSYSRSLGNGGVGTELFTKSANWSSGLGRRVSVTNFGPVEHSGSLTLQHNGERTKSTTAWATAGSMPSGGTLPQASAAINASGAAELVLPASSTPLVSGNSFVFDVNVSKWRFGVWVSEVIEAIVP